MRYEKGHKDTTRQHIIEVASRQFRGHGVAAVGLAGIMSDAGLTNGAFYTHFDSKEDLVQAVLAKALDRREERLRAVAADNAGLETMIRDYLSSRHRDRPDDGCPTAALVAEVARHPKATRDAFTAKVSTFIELIATQIQAGSVEARRLAVMKSAADPNRSSGRFANARFITSATGRGIHGARSSRSGGGACACS